MSVNVYQDADGEYSYGTNVGSKRKKIYHDKKWKRPVERKDYLRQIEATRLVNRYDAAEFGRFCADCGVPVKPLRDYTDDELKLILDEFARYRMILYVPDKKSDEC